MFKSCQYCRHRKKKCIWNATDRHGPCVACQHLGVACEVETRQPSLKRQKNSQEVAASVKASHATSSQQPKAYLDERLVLPQDGDCQIPRDDRGRVSKELLFQDRSGRLDGLSSSEKYTQALQNELPFVPIDYLANEASPLFEHCVELAASLSIYHGNAQITDLGFECLKVLVHEQDLTDKEVAGLLLLLPRLRLNHAIVEKVFDAARRDGTDLQVTLPVAAGALTAYTWLCLCGQPHHSIDSPSSILVEYAATLEQNTFAPHFLKLTHLAASFLELAAKAKKEGLTFDLKRSWAKLEYASLLNVVEMEPQFLDVRDDMPASPAAIITHMLQNLIYLRLYSFMLSEKPGIGEALSLRPVPGVLYFLCAIARSTFVCQQRVIDFWPLIADFQAEAARIMLQLWQLTHFENCRALLKLWNPITGHEALVGEVRECVGTGPWSIEHIDGFSVFWTFRDMRSLGLEIYMRP